MNEEIFWQLASKLLAGEASPTQEEELKSIIASNKVLKKKWLIAKAQWQATPQLPTHDRSRARKLLLEGLKKTKGRRNSYT
ncbi:hypothetical protein LVD15_26220 [Fulvivirga maritima]|uniref:hypothetical protein n=1 Tax=Fulvivirga maritima TaxID=2904247 RepID=UPI001F1BEFB4|nr:hypothetical protein [Fulvivirga maritima]UII26750.1 hypothetical protein LVD15_26220 [Fulvivirga maritima]